MLFKCLPAETELFRKPMLQLFSEPWIRAGKKDVELHTL